MLFWVDPQTKLVAVLMAQTPQVMLDVIWRQTQTIVEALDSPRRTIRTYHALRAARSASRIL